jgi:hypothetical protein
MIDYKQVRSLIKYSLLSTWRSSSGTKRKISKGLLFWNIFVYIFSGVALAGILLLNHVGESLHFGLTILSLYVFLITLSNIFVEFGSGFLSPDEVTILSPYPISSETFFVSRLSVLLFYTLINSLLLSIGGTVAMVLITNTYLVPIVTMQLMYLLSALSAALLVVVIFSILLRKIPHGKLTKAFSYAHLFGTLITLSGLIVIPRILESDTPQSLTFAIAPWLKFTPGYFLSSFAATSLNEGSLVLGLPFLAVIALDAVMLIVGARLLATTYLDAVGDVRQGAVDSTRDAKRVVIEDGVRSSILFRTPESRVMWKLFRAQFRNDTKFRLGVISLLPITAIYFVIMVVNGSVADPFVETAVRTVLEGTMLYLLILLSPMLLMQMVSQSEAHKASWIFFSTPIDRSRLLLSMKNIVLFNLFLPYLLILGATFAYFMPLEHAGMHTIMLGLTAMLIFEVYLLITPKLPFSEQRKQQRSAITSIVYMVFVALIPGAILTLIIHLAYGSTRTFWQYAALVATVALAAHLFVRRRLAVKLEQQEYSA